jgi:hypothetical protein
MIDSPSWVSGGYGASVLGDFLHDLPLRRLASEVTRAGQTAMRRRPHLVAAVDQHAAAVRDMLATDERGMHPTAVFDYLRGFLEGARERGWYPAVGVFDEWEDIRLLACCQMARQKAA